MSKYLLFRERGNTHCGMKITPVTITLSARFDKEEDAIIIDFKDSSTGTQVHKEYLFLDSHYESISEFTEDGQTYILDRVIEAINEDLPSFAEELVRNEKTLLEFDMSDYVDKWYKVGIDMMRADYMQKHHSNKETE